MIELAIIAGGAAVVLLLTLGEKLNLLFWVMVLSIVIGPRRQTFFIGDERFQFVPYVVIMALLLVFTILAIRQTTNLLEALGYITLSIGVAGALVSDVRFSEWVEWIIPLAGVFFTSHLMQVFVRKEHEYEWLKWAFVGICAVIAGGIVLTGLGVSMGRFLIAAGSYGVGDGREVTRAAGFWGDATVAGVAVLSILLVPHLRLPTLLKVALVLLQVASVTLSGKRLAFLSLALCAIFLIIGMPNLRARIGAFALVGVMAVGVWLMMPTHMVDRFDQARAGLEGERQDQRVIRYTRAWEIITDNVDNVLLGRGAGAVVFIHNGPLEIVANMGIPGMVLLLVFGWPVLQSFRLQGFQNPWMQVYLVFLLSPFMLEAVLNRQEHMAVMGFLYGALRLENQRLLAARNLPAPASPPYASATHGHYSHV